MTLNDLESNITVTLMLFTFFHHFCLFTMCCILHFFVWRWLLCVCCLQSNILQRVWA